LLRNPGDKPSYYTRFVVARARPSLNKKGALSAAVGDRESPQAFSTFSKLRSKKPELGGEEK
jgi:hypothetical protein